MTSRIPPKLKSYGYVKDANDMNMFKNFTISKSKTKTKRIDTTTTTTTTTTSTDVDSIDNTVKENTRKRSVVSNSRTGDSTQNRTGIDNDIRDISSNPPQKKYITTPLITGTTTTTTTTIGSVANNNHDDNQPHSIVNPIFFGVEKRKNELKSSSRFPPSSSSSSSFVFSSSSSVRFPSSSSSSSSLLSRPPIIQRDRDARTNREKGKKKDSESTDRGKENTTNEIRITEEPYPSPFFLNCNPWKSLLDTQVVLAEHMGAKTRGLDVPIYRLYWVGLALESGDIPDLIQKNRIRLPHVNVLVNEREYRNGIENLKYRDRDADVYAFRTSQMKFLRIGEELLSKMYANVKLKNINRNNVTCVGDRVLSILPKSVLEVRLKEAYGVDNIKRNTIPVTNTIPFGLNIKTHPNNRREYKGEAGGKKIEEQEEEEKEEEEEEKIGDSKRGADDGGDNITDDVSGFDHVENSGMDIFPDIMTDTNNINNDYRTEKNPSDNIISRVTSTDVITNEVSDSKPETRYQKTLKSALIYRNTHFGKDEQKNELSFLKKQGMSFCLLIIFFCFLFLPFFLLPRPITVVFFEKMGGGEKEICNSTGVMYRV
jgi:hypothetical protein